MSKLIITVAPTGSIPTKKMNPHVPITPEEIIETGVRCERLGASIIHVHARNPVDESPSTDFAIFEEIYNGLKARTDLIIQISTGGRAGTSYEERNERLKLSPEMASLTTGSVNFPNSVYANSPDLIDSLAADMQRLKIKPEMEIFDVSMVNNALALVQKNLVDPAPSFRFCPGLKRRAACYHRKPGAFKKFNSSGCHLVSSGYRARTVDHGHPCHPDGRACRVGLEDNIFFQKGDPASNERLVERMIDLAKILGRPVATPEEARALLNL